jgi:hypothetical protein
MFSACAAITTIIRIVNASAVAISSVDDDSFAVVDVERPSHARRFLRVGTRL